MCGVEECEYLRDRAPVQGANDSLGLDRACADGEGPVGQRGMQVDLFVDPVTRGGARRRRQDAVALEIAHLLNGASGTSGHIDGPHHR